MAQLIRNMTFDPFFGLQSTNKVCLSPPRNANGYLVCSYDVSCGYILLHASDTNLELQVVGQNEKKLLNI